MLEATAAELHHQLGLSLFACGRFRESLESHRRAAKIDPGHGDAHLRAGMLLWFQNEFDGAMVYLRCAIALRPDDATAHAYYGLALYGGGALGEAGRECDAALSLDPISADAQIFRGLVHHALGDTAEARASYARVLQLDPQSAHAHVFLAESLLLDGDYEHGWREYEWRLRSSWWRATKVDAPRWDGSPLDGRTLFVHSEQGFGDTIQFVRFVLRLIDEGHEVIAEVQPQLAALLRAVPALRDRVVARGDARPPFNVHAPLLSLPHLLKMRSVPPSSPYLHAAPRAFSRDAFNVGIAWQGSRTHRLDRHRSVPLRTLLPLADCGARLLSLQHGFGSEQLEPSMPIEATPETYGFAEAASFIAGLDLVITIDSVVAHLAGALGVPTWLLLPYVPDARWLRDGDDTPWYPTVRLFRQESPFDWDRVVDAVASRLREISAPFPLLNHSEVARESVPLALQKKRRRR